MILGTFALLRGGPDSDPWKLWVAQALGRPVQQHGVGGPLQQAAVGPVAELRQDLLASAGRWTALTLVAHMYVLMWLFHGRPTTSF